MADLGAVEVEEQVEEETSLIPVDEGVCGMMFDIQGWTYATLFPDGTAKTNFGSGETQKVTTLAEAEALGITSSFMGGIPHYHISQFYSYVGESCNLYLSFPDLSTNDSAFENMLMESDSAIYQIGVWSNAAMFDIDGGDYVFTDMIQSIQNQIELIDGTEDDPSAYPSGINVVLCGGTWLKSSPTTAIDYRYLPDCKEKDFKKISILIGQDGADAVHTMMNSMPYPAQVGLLGKMMACLHLAGAEENIAYVANFNINKSDTMTSAELGFGTSYTPVANINSIRGNLMTNKGYIFPVTYEAKEGCVYFSSDDTMSDGDYDSIHLCRVIHKFKRVGKRVLLPRVNGRMAMNNDLKHISSAEVTALESELNTAFTSLMVNSQGQNQYTAYLIEIDDEQDEMDNDKLKLSLTISALQSQNEITVTVE